MLPTSLPDFEKKLFIIFFYDPIRSPRRPDANFTEKSPPFPTRPNL